MCRYLSHKHWHKEKQRQHASNKLLDPAVVMFRAALISIYQIYQVDGGEIKEDKVEQQTS